MTRRILADGGATRDEIATEMRRRSLVAIGLAAVLAAVGIVVWGSNQWTSIMYWIVAVTQALIAAGLLYRIGRRDDPTSTGNVTVQHSWGLVSIGIAAAALFTSAFFAVDIVWVGTAVAVSSIWAVLGAHNLYWTINRTEARLTV